MSGLVVGATVAGCRLEAVAGEGGMGVVYRATQLGLGRPVAFKAITPRFATDEVFRERFVRESRLTASIDHANIIPVYEAGELETGTLYLVARWVDGVDLRALLSSTGRLGAEEAVKLLVPVASALDAAHQRGLIHRDVKPANVLVAAADRHVYLTDFGIARQDEDEPGPTSTGAFVGTLDYMAPERFEGDRGGPASDIYALGCVLFEALAGHVPFPRASDPARISAQLHERAPSVCAEVPGTPLELDEVVQKAMAKDPDRRYRTAGEMAAAMEAALSAGRARVQAETAAGAPPRSRGDRDKGSRRRAAILAGALLLVATGGTIGLIALSGGGGGGTDRQAASTPSGTVDAAARQHALSGLPPCIRRFLAGTTARQILPLDVSVPYPASGPEGRPVGFVLGREPVGAVRLAHFLSPTEDFEFRGALDASTCRAAPVRDYNGGSTASAVPWDNIEVDLSSGRYYLQPTPHDDGGGFKIALALRPQ